MRSPRSLPSLAAGAPPRPAYRRPFLFMTQITLTVAAGSVELISPFDWDQCVEICNRYFGGPSIGGPEMPKQEETRSKKRERKTKAAR